ncbi:hypothetical protein AT984_01255 [Paucibacter sp. KCTC 42545]|nr:hypothetical protein AT984_01255 [Paucibacter sp. KCTC 42545]
MQQRIETLFRSKAYDHCGQLTHALIHSRRGQIVKCKGSQMEAVGEALLALRFQLLGTLATPTQALTH